MPMASRLRRYSSCELSGRRLQDHLELRVHLHAVRVLGVAAVVGPVARLDVGHVPRLGPQHAQDGGRVGRAGAHLLAVRLPDQAALLGPVLLQPHDDFLERQRFCR